jgi:xanthine/uracil permease
VSAVLWVVAVIPSAFGFWLVAGDLAGVPPSDTRTLIFASMLTLGLATLAQVAAGYRLLLYEGPAAAYLAAIVVVTAGGHGLAAITGGLIVAGVAVVALGLLRFDRLLLALLTPLASLIFVLVVCIAVIPATVQRAIGSSSAHPLGTGAAWAAAAAVVGAGLLLQRVQALRAYALLGALLAGTAASFAVAGIPDASLGGGLAVPELLPWGAPEISAGVVAPFLVAALLIAYNEIAAIEVAGTAYDMAPPPHAGPRGLAVHGIAQVAGAVAGNVLGTVARLDSVPIVHILGNRRRVALALAAVLAMALAFVEPFLGLVAAVPLPVTAGLLAFMLVSLVVAMLARVWVLGRRARVITAVALVPSIVWTPLQDSLSATAQLLGNPMLWGVALGIVLERAMARRDRTRPTKQGVP